MDGRRARRHESITACLDHREAVAASAFVINMILVALARPALAMLATFTFMLIWHEVTKPLICLQKADPYATIVGCAFLPGQFVDNWPQMTAGAMVSLAR